MKKEQSGQGYEGYAHKGIDFKIHSDRALSQNEICGLTQKVVSQYIGVLHRFEQARANQAALSRVLAGYYYGFSIDQLKHAAGYLKGQLGEEKSILSQAAESNAEFRQHINDGLKNLEAHIKGQEQPGRHWHKRAKTRFAAVAAGVLALLFPSYSFADNAIAIPDKAYEVLIKANDANGDKKLEGEEFANLARWIRGEERYFLEKYDKDGNRELSSLERAEAGKNEGERWRTFETALNIKEGAEYESWTERNDRILEIRERERKSRENQAKERYEERGQDISIYIEANNQKIDGTGDKSSQLDLAYKKRLGRKKSLEAELDSTCSCYATGSSSSETTDLGGDVYEDAAESQSDDVRQNRTTLRFNVDLTERFNLGIFGSDSLRESDSNESHTSHIYSPTLPIDLTVNTTVDERTVEDGYNYGITAMWRINKNIDLGALAKYERTEQTTTITVDNDGTVDSGSIFRGVDYPTAGIRARIKADKDYRQTRAGIDLLFRDENNIDVQPENTAEGNFYILQQLNDDWSLSGDLRVRGEKFTNVTGHFNVHYTPDGMYSAEERNDRAARSLDDLTNDRSFFGDQPWALENLRFMQALQNNNGGILQIGGSKEQGGYTDFRLGWDWEIGNRKYQNLGANLAVRDGSLEDLVDLMVYYKWETNHNALLNQNQCFWLVGVNADFRTDEVRRDKSGQGGLIFSFSGRW
jgi:hypothetical protein